jgi:hypothetical protein
MNQSGRTLPDVSREDLSRPAGSEATHEPRPSRLPVAFDGNHRDAYDFGHFVFRQPTEEPELNDPRCARIEGFELRQRHVERHQIFILCHRIPPVDGAQGEPLLRAAPLLRDTGPRMVDQNPSHRLRGNGKEVSARPIGDWLGAEQADAQFIHERMRLECVVPALVMEQT